jgi:hypothetical protein
MVATKLTDNEIRIRIVPTHVRWPEPSSTPAWARLRDCVKALHTFTRKIENESLEIKRMFLLDRDSLVRQHADLASRALQELANFQPLQIAERSVAKELGELNKNPKVAAQQQRDKQILIKALEELRGGIAATERLVQERCGVRERPRLPV